MKRSVSLGLLAAIAGVSCAEVAAPPVVTVPAEASPAPAAPPAPMPARWVDSGGATAIGPKVARGRLVLLGGRRAVVLPDGSVETAAVATSEPLQEMTLVPSTSGARLVGRGEHEVYRFDDPLGAATVLARSDRALIRLGAGPGLVAVWTARGSQPRFVDVESGQEKMPAGLPMLPMRAAAFLDAQRGAAVFEAVGLSVTVDGGKSWRGVTGIGARDALAVNGLRNLGEGVRAFGYTDGPVAVVDIDRGRLSAFEAPQSSSADPPLVRWIRGSLRDPLEAAAAGGLDLPAGGALVASHGMVARVDPRSGSIGELVELARGKWVPCNAGRVGTSAWLACTLPDRPSDEHRDRPGLDLFDPFGVLRLPLGVSPLAPDRPVLMRNGEADLRVSPSGGVMLMAACSGEEQGVGCVRQPDGKWRTIPADFEMGERGAGPLADGRVAFLRGLFDGDEAPESEAAEGEEQTKRLHVATLDPSGKERALAVVPFKLTRGNVRVQSNIEEDADHTLRFVIEDGDGPYAVVVPPGKDGPTVQRIPDATDARLHGGRGLALGDGHILASLDGGVTWNDVPAPPAALEAARGVAEASDGGEGFAVSDVGAKVGTMLRLGWGPAELNLGAADPPKAAAPLATLATSDAEPAAPEPTLVCSAGGPAPGLPPLLGLAQAQSLLTGRPKEPREVRSARRDPSVWGARLNALETVALVEEGAPDKRTGTVGWTFRWHDPREIGGKVRSAAVKVLNPGSNVNLRYAASAGGRALFAVRSGGKFRLVRVTPGGHAEVTEVAQDLLPATEVVFGAERGEPIAWLHETHVVAWLAGQKPRIVAEVSPHAARNLGTPTASGLPLLLTGNDWAAARILPIPPLDKASPEKPPPPTSVTLDGWTQLKPLRKPLGDLPVCSIKTKAPRFVLERGGLHAEVEGASADGSTSVYSIRIQGNEACLDGVASMLTFGRQGTKVPAKAKPGNAAFVRVDLTHKRAEGGERGVAPDSEVRQMKCLLRTAASNEDAQRRPR